MTQENQISPKKPNLNKTFSFRTHKDYFEVDTHSQLSGHRISRIETLAGQLADDDIYLLIYDGIPNLSLYNSQGKLIDIDHYLPDDYNAVDADSIDTLLANFSGLDTSTLTDDGRFLEILENIRIRGNQDFFFGLETLFGIECSAILAETFVLEVFGEVSTSEVVSQISTTFTNLKEFLISLLTFLQKAGSGYIHVTAKGNIIITPLLRRSGLSLIIETHDAKGHLIKPRKWNIVRTNSAKQLDQSLVFRSPDVKAFFEENPTTEYNRTLRYVLFRKQEELVFDSLLDNTDNLLRLPLYNDCFQILAADEDVVMLLNNPNKITIVNAHRSVVPQKWAQEILLPFSVKWARVDQNINAVFVQNEAGLISALSISGETTELLAEIGIFRPGFEIDQAGNLLVQDGSGLFMLVSTTINEYQNPNDKKGISDILKNLSHLFQTDELFSEKQFARIITKTEDIVETLPPSIIDKLKFDFETNVEHMLVKAGNSYEKLLIVKQQIGLARQNLSDELTFQADKEQVQLVGYKLKRIVNVILSPMEARVDEIVELSRSTFLLMETENFVSSIGNLQTPINIEKYSIVFDLTRTSLS